MKTTKLFLIGLALSALTACTQEDATSGPDFEQTDITLSAPAFDTDWGHAAGSSDGKKRTKLDLDEKFGLNFSWTQGDIVGVFAENSQQQLPMMMKEGQDAAAKVYFNREDYELKAGVTYVGYYPVVDRLLQKPNITISYLGQTQAANGSYSHLAKYDYMVSDRVTVEKTNTADFNFNHQGAILRLLIDMPEADTYSSVELKAVENGASSKAFTTEAEMRLFDTQEVINPTAKEESVILKFEGNKVFTTADNKLLEAWIMVSPVDFTSKAMTVVVTSATGKDKVEYTVNPGKNFVKGKAYQIKVPGDVVDHSKNPLEKWAKADLVYNSSTQTSYIPEGDNAYTTQGSLYQWGRNIGWSDYRDAMGGSVLTSAGKFWEYATYNRIYKTGTGLNRGEDDRNDYSYDSSNDSFSEPIYFMRPNSTDYWIGSGGGSTWDERAAKCGYTASLCPEGWRMPTKADFLEIKPSAPLSGSGSLAEVVNNRVELRKIDGVCTYAIRWTVETKSSKTYLRIDALVVPDSFSESALSSIAWNTDKNVRTRYFGANGFIHAFYHVNVIQNGTSIDNFPVARPMPGTETHEDVLTRVGSYYYTILYNYIKDYSVNNEGYYWMSDEKTAFTFQDNTRVKNAQKTANNTPNGTYAFPGRLSVFGILPVDAQDCCAVRCVRDTK